MTSTTGTTTPAGVEAPRAWREHGLPPNLAPLADHLERWGRDGAEAPGGYVFWDCETTGLSPQHDQILQLAAIRTDGDFNIVDEREDVLDLRCDLAPGVVPSPTALLTTRVWPERLSGSGMTLPAMIDRVAEAFDRWRLPRLPDGLETKRADLAVAPLAAGPTVFLGWNSLRFDEEFMRHALFRSLHGPYLTQSGGALRADAMIMAQAAHLLHPGAIVAPETVDPKTGRAKLSFRLGDLARANGVPFDATEAHDALADVRATLAVCRLIRERAPMAFDLMLRNARKQNVTATIASNWAGVPGFDPQAARSGGSAGAPDMAGVRPVMQPYALCAIHGGKASARAVMPIGSLPDGGALLALDLSIDPAGYLGLSDDDLRRLAKERTGWPIVPIRANRQPILLPLELRQGRLPPVFEALVATIAPEGGDAVAAQAILIDRLERIRTAERLTPGRIARLIALADDLTPDHPASDLVEEQLYAGGFPSRADEELRERMRGMAPEAFVRHIPALGDPRLRAFAARRAFMMFPEALPEAEREGLKALFAARILAPPGETPQSYPWRTAADAHAEIETLRARHADGPAETLAHLDAIEAFLDRLVARSLADAAGGSEPGAPGGRG